MIARQFQRSVLLVLTAWLLPLSCHMDSEEKATVEDLRQEIDLRLNNFILEQLAKEENADNAHQRQESHHKEEFPPAAHFHAHLRGPSNRPTPLQALRLTLAAPLHSPPPASVVICIHDRCFTLRRRPRRGHSRQFHSSTLRYTLPLNGTTHLPADVHIRLRKASRVTLAFPPTLEAITTRPDGGYGRERAVARVVRSALTGRSRRSASTQDWLTGPCKLHQWVVSTAEVGLKHIFSSPDNLTLGYCAGQCVDDAPISHNAKVRRYHRLVHADSTVPPPVCVPIRYQNQWVAVQKGALIENHLFRKFTAIDCACL